MILFRDYYWQGGLFFAVAGQFFPGTREGECSVLQVGFYVVAFRPAQGDVGVNESVGEDGDAMRWGVLI